MVFIEVWEQENSFIILLIMDDLMILQIITNPTFILLNLR